MSSTETTFPIPRASSKRKHFKWSCDEDVKLMELVSKSKKPDWVKISAEFKNRNPRQCQERWSYYLSPYVNNGPWTAQEDIMLFQKYAEFGSRWVDIAKFIKGRTNTSCKNRYLAIKRAAAKGDIPDYLKIFFETPKIDIIGSPQVGDIEIDADLLNGDLELFEPSHEDLDYVFVDNM